MNRYNMSRCTTAGVFVALVLALCATAFAAGSGAKASLLDSNNAVVGSVSAKNGNLGSFVINTSLQKGEANTTYYVTVVSDGTEYSAGDFTTSRSGKGGRLYVLDGQPITGDFVVYVSTTEGATDEFSTDTMTL